MAIRDNKLNSQIRHYLFALLVIVAVTLCAWALRDLLTLANFTTINLLIVLVIAIRWGTGPALMTAFLTFLSINFFLVQPYYTFIVADPRELLDLVVFLVVAVLTGQLAARARHQADVAQRRAYEQEILYRLTRSFNQLTTQEGVYEVLTSVLKIDLGAKDAYILPYASEPASRHYTVHYLLLQVGEQIYATLCVAFEGVLTPQQSRLMNTCATQSAMALQRIDLTERARKSAQFEESDRLKTAILHAASHDLRTPITIIKSSASNLRQLGERLSPEERTDIAGAIENEADELDKLVGNLLDMSRLKAGALQLNRDLNALEEVAGDVAARVWQRTRQECIKLEFEEDMPLVSFDYGLILQALTNIVDNALRYEPAESLIKICGKVQGDEVRLMVVNHGDTIPPSEADHIMEPFYHGQRGNIGLGLSIAKGIVEAHNGRLWVEETVGGGATFVISLPLEQMKNETQNSDR